MGRGRRQATGAVAAREAPLSDGDSRRRPVPQFTTAVEETPEPTPEKTASIRYSKDSDGNSVANLWISDVEVAVHLGVNGGFNDAFIDAAIDEALSQHGPDAEVVAVDGDEPGRHLEVTVNDGDLIFIYICDHI